MGRCLRVRESRDVKNDKRGYLSIGESLDW